MTMFRDQEGGCCGSKGKKLGCGIVSGILFVIAVVGLGVILALHCVTFRRDQYGLVFDGGSSHTYLFMYRWPGDKIEDTGDVLELQKCKVDGGGISSYKDNPDDAGVSIMSCLDEVKKKVPKDRVAATPVYLGATAGMRLLSEQNPTASKAIIAAIEKRFEDSGLLYENGNVQIIDGVEEGISAWTSSNLLLGNLGQNGTREKSVGTMDMGGASTQISFETAKKGEEDRTQDHQDLRLYGFDFPIFAHTFLCYGMDQIVLRFKSELAIDDPKQGATVINPCANKGFSEAVSAKDLFNTKCTLAGPKTPHATYTFISDPNPNPQACIDKISKFLDVTRCRDRGYGECFNTGAVPEIPSDMKFYAISGYFFTADFFNGTKTTPDGFQNLTNEFCKLPWDEAKHQPGAAEKFLARYCFVGHYIHLVLTQMYKFDTPEKWKNLEFSATIAGVSSGWTLGFMTNATNTLPVEAIRGIKSQVFTALLAVFIVLLVIVVIVGCVICVRSRRSSS